MLEIPRNRKATGWKLCGGLFIALCAAAAATAPSDRELWETIVGTAMIGLPAALLLVSQVWILVRRPLGLCATEAGVWFGGGPIVAWSEVESIYEASGTVQRYGMSAEHGGVALAFRHKRTVLRLPPYCWLTSFTLGVVRVSTLESPQHPGALAAQLERLRFAACGHEDGALPGATRPPDARIVRR